MISDATVMLAAERDPHAEPSSSAGSKRITSRNLAGQIHAFSTF